MRDIAATLEVAFGRVKLSYEQLAEQRNNTRQGATENTGNYIKRYEEINTRIQRALDTMPSDYRESLRYMENKIHIKKFIESLRTDLEIRLMTNFPSTLRAAFAEAQRIDKKLQDDEILHRTRSQSHNSSQKTFNSRVNPQFHKHAENSQKINKPIDSNNSNINA